MSDEMCHGAGNIRRLYFLSRLGELLPESVDRSPDLQPLAHLVVPDLADVCVFDVVCRDDTLRRIAMAHADPTVQAMLDEHLLLHPAPCDEAPAHAAIRANTTMQLPELPTPALLAMMTAGALDAAQSSVLGPVLLVPLVAREHTLGVMTLILLRDSKRGWDDTDIELAEQVARRAVTSLDNARLYKEAQDALRVRDQFLSIAAHDLKSPVTTIVGYADLLQRRARRMAGTTERDLKALQTMVAQARRLQRMIDLLFDLTRMQQGQLIVERKPLDLAALARDQVRALEGTLTQHSVRTSIPDTPVMIEGDDLRLEQVIQNLLQNAIKYSPAGGVVTVEVGDDADGVYLLVADQGIGIPAGAIPRLFAQFYRADNVGADGAGGLGLGLYVVNQIVTAHGGSVEVTSEIGRGSTFTVRLPRLT